MHTNNHPSTPRYPAMRSRVTSGRQLFVEGDGRGAWARRFRDLIAAHSGDLGGADFLSEAQRSLIRRAACLEVSLRRPKAGYPRAAPLTCKFTPRRQATFGAS